MKYTPESLSKQIKIKQNIKYAPKSTKSLNKWITKIKEKKIKKRSFVRNAFILKETLMKYSRYDVHQQLQ